MTKVVLPTLYKAKTSGGFLIWRTWLTPEIDGSGTIHVEHGEQGGKLQHTREVIRVGKNIGKRNEKTPFAQAEAEMRARWSRQLARKQYAEDLATAKDKRAAYPMLAYKYSDHAEKIKWDTAFAQPKLDGFRCMAQLGDDGKTVSLVTRERLPVKTMAHIAEELTPVLRESPEMVLDGELYAHGLGFQKLASAIRKKGENTEKICYRIFDTVADDGFGKRFGEMRSRLQKFSLTCVGTVKTVKVRSEQELFHFQREVLNEGYEGSILRHSPEGYDAGKRSSNLLKFKEFKEGEFAIVDAKEGRGTHMGTAIFVCSTKAGHFFDVLAPGTMEHKRQCWTDHRKYIGKWLVVSYFGMTSSEESVPYHATAIKVRAVKGIDLPYEYGVSIAK